MKTNPNDSISPVHESTRVLQNGMDDMSSCILAGGLTKREYFAGLAMQGLLSAGMAVDSLFHSNSHNKDQSCAIAVKYADALIKELNKKEGE